MRPRHPRPATPVRGKSRCPIQGKLQYQNEAEADRDCAMMVLNGKALFMRAYLCPHCSAWHITSQPVIVDKLPKRAAERRERDDGV